MAEIVALEAIQCEFESHREHKFHGLVFQSAEKLDSKSIQCRFESYLGHCSEKCTLENIFHLMIMLVGKPSYLV